MAENNRHIPLPFNESTRITMDSSGLKRMAAMAATLAILSLSTSAFAQYVWLNDKGVKQYSDMPPPSSVPNNRIVKAPGAAMRTTSPVPPDGGENGVAAAPATEKIKIPMTTAEKNMDFQKRKIEQAEKDKKTAEEKQRAADKSKNCERAREYQNALDSGQRIAHTGKNGERAYMSDAQRSQETKDTQRILGDCK
jgi:hypothetical protein